MIQIPISEQMVEQEEFARLQILVMEHELALEQYSDLIRDQQGQINVLHKKIERLEQKISKYDDTASVDATSQDDPPPHY